jgi:hypothetical protein
MATYLMFGTLTPEAMKAVSAKRTDVRHINAGGHEGSQRQAHG